MFLGTLYAHILSLKKTLQPTLNKLQLDPKTNFGEEPWANFRNTLNQT